MVESMMLDRLGVFGKVMVCVTSLWNLARTIKAGLLYFLCEVGVDVRGGALSYVEFGG